MRIKYNNEEKIWEEDSFNIARALSVMCCEIEKLKKDQQNAALDELVKKAQENGMGTNARSNNCKTSF